VKEPFYQWYPSKKNVRLRRVVEAPQVGGVEVSPGPSGEGSPDEEVSVPAKRVLFSWWPKSVESKVALDAAAFP